jgi:hypothetical protein
VGANRDTVVDRQSYGIAHHAGIARVKTAGNIGGGQVRHQPRVRVAAGTSSGTLPDIAIQVDAHRVTVHPCNFFYISEHLGGALMGFY